MFDNSAFAACLQWENSGVRVSEEVTRDAVVRGASEPTEKGTVSGSQEGKLALTSSQPNRSQSRRQTLLKWHVECERSCSKLVLIEYCRENEHQNKIGLLRQRADTRGTLTWKAGTKAKVAKTTNTPLQIAARQCARARSNRSDQYC